MLRRLTRNRNRQQPLSLLYTMHDYDEETRYAVHERYLRRFTPFPFPAEPSGHALVGGLVYTSHYGINQSDAVSCVSEVLAADLVSGRVSVVNGGLILDALQDKARARRFVGIPNGVELPPHLDPATSPPLVRAGVHFGAAERCMAISPQRPASACPAPTPEVRVSIVSLKATAKRTLHAHGVLTSAQSTQPLVLFVGRFQINKGIDVCEAAARILQTHNATFVVLGMATAQSTGGLVKQLRALGVVVIDDLKVRGARCAGEGTEGTKHGAGRKDTRVPGRSGHGTRKRRMQTFAPVHRNTHVFRNGGPANGGVRTLTDPRRVRHPLARSR